MKTKFKAIGLLTIVLLTFLIGTVLTPKIEAGGTPQPQTLTLFTNQIAIGGGGSTYGGATNTNGHASGMISLLGTHAGLVPVITFVDTVTNNGTSNIVAGINVTADGLNWTTTPFLQFTNNAAGSNGPVCAVWQIPLSNLVGLTAISVDYLTTLQTNAIGIAATVTFQLPQ